MTYWISKARYARITEGMTPEQIAGVDAWFTVYPDPVDERLFQVDQDRIADEYARLVAEQPLPLAPSRPVYVGGRRGGHWHLPEPWAEVAANMWWAPVGTPPPAASDWATLADLDYEVLEPDPARRYFLNDRVQGVSAWDPATAGSPLDDMRELMERFRGYEPPPPRQLRAGENALVAIAAGARPAARGWPKDTPGTAGALADLTGIPIVRDPNLPPNAWQLVDLRTGEVLYEGDVGDRLGAYVEVMREYAAEVGERAGVPYGLLDPEGL